MTKSTTILRRQLGRQLRELRLASGLSIVEAARRIERGAGTVQRLEKGENPKIRLLDVEALTKLYDATERLDGLLEIAKRARNGEGEGGAWWHKYGDVIPEMFALLLDLETIASSLTMYRPELLPGLLQTAAYTRALDSAYFRRATPDELDERVRVRLNRQRIITRRYDPVKVHLLLEEAVIRRVIGGPRVMAEQLRHLADLPPNVTVQIIPFGARYPLGTATGQYTLLDFDENTGEPPIVYVEGYGTSTYYERKGLIDRYRSAFGQLRGVALSPADSKRLLRTASRECRA
ncbi:helix-turn-helix domain-containing protein [Nocardia cyriacigeorgica]|uniref:helix-turn-helix domain-containing protein n=1 Tax=Nocardia cyriacigeorgica TaxID=135487 RepID=UPI0003190CD4|nr:helix-turn-helix transcriptional regulator [Nocardia cyriacigeorgica]AVH24612.1 XRE family transcriptional regulator [Nocardia cyriacigeorgica]PPJ02381.1 XRE family transcriptional regulator [Nocardia cyriacigeorgica]TLF53156.1 helix-turn-helix domain-containing protein [Nocardia cyriacigeorgica]